MSKIASMLKALKRDKKSQSSFDEAAPGSRKSRTSVLDAESFVFLPGDSGVRGDREMYWGEIINDESFPASQRRDARRRTHIGLESEKGMQEVNLVIRTHSEVTEKDEKFLLNGKMYNRRYSGSLINAKKGIEDEDGAPVIRDYAFLLTNNNEQTSRGRYVYDRLVRAPLQPSNSSQSSQPRRMTIVADGQSKEDLERCSLRKKDLTAQSKGPVDGTRLLQVANRNTGKPNRPISLQTDGHNYSDLEWFGTITGSEYAFPPDAVSWELRLEDTDMYEVLPMKGYRTIAPQDLSLGDKIGEGQFGDVHSGYLYPATHDEKEVAIKTCKPDASQEDRGKFLEEAMVMCKFKHPNIIKLYGVVSHMNLAYIVMELAPHGQLRRHLLVEGMKISRLLLLDYIVQLASAMVHLEEMNFVHRDIAARNILVCTPQVVKLADFGLSRGLEDGDYYVASRGKLPIKWMAPESINFRRFTGLSDVWMFGVCCWEILMRGVKPFVGIKNDEVISKIETGERLPLPKECPAPLFALMNSCWNYDPLDRPRFVEIEARIQEILHEESQLEHLTGRRYNSDLKANSPIMRDPDAPSKPARHPGGGGWEQGYPQGRVSSDSNSSRHSHANDVQSNDAVPPLPPRAMERFREVSDSPTGLGEGGAVQYSSNNSSGIPPPRAFSNQRPYGGSQEHLRGMGVAEAPSHYGPPQISSSSSLVPPYSVTTIGQQQQHQQQQQQRLHYQDQQRRQDSSPQLYSHHQHHPQDVGGSSPQLPLNSHIPPPAILGHHPSQPPQLPHQQSSPQFGHAPQSRSSPQFGQRRMPDPDTGMYYPQDHHPPGVNSDRNLSIPAQLPGNASAAEKKQQRMLTKDGVFVSRDIMGSGNIGDVSPKDGVRPRFEGRPMSHASTEGSSGRSSPAVSADERQHVQSPPQQPALPSEGSGQESEGDGFTIPEEDDVLKYATGVVKSVKELSDKIHKCKPSDYVDLVKGVGFALRELLGKVDVAIGELPSETHNEVVMAQKVLTSDMNQLVKAMKDAQSHYDKFLEQEYQKKMLKAAHVVAVNSKLLLDAVNSARRKAHLRR